MGILSFRLIIILFLNIESYDLCDLIPRDIPYKIIQKFSPGSGQTGVTWQRDGVDIFTVQRDGTGPNCTIFNHVPSSGLRPYCHSDFLYELELQAPNSQMERIFTTSPTGEYSGQTINILEPGTVKCSPEEIIIKSSSVLQFSCGVYNTNCNDTLLELEYFDPGRQKKGTIAHTNFTYVTDSSNSLLNITATYYISKDLPGFSEITTIQAIFIVKYGETTDNSTVVNITYIRDPEDICSFCYSLVLLIIKAVLVAGTIIVISIHLYLKDDKKNDTVHWVINVVLIILIIVCLILAIIQILYVTSVIACPDLDLCSDEPGHNAAIAFVVFGFLATIACIVILVIRMIKGE